MNIPEIIIVSVSNIDVYLGAQEKEQRGGAPLAESVVVNLCKHIKGKGDNITCDNCFTSLPVAKKTCDRQTLFCRNNEKKSMRVVQKSN